MWRRCRICRWYCQQCRRWYQTGRERTGTYQRNRKIVNQTQKGCILCTAFVFICIYRSTNFFTFCSFLLALHIRINDFFYCKYSILISKMYNTAVLKKTSVIPRVVIERLIARPCDTISIVFPVSFSAICYIS